MVKKMNYVFIFPYVCVQVWQESAGRNADSDLFMNIVNDCLFGRFLKFDLTAR
jgi:hypothetical protein